MYGTLRVKGVEVNVFDLTIYDVIKQLQNIKDIEFTVAPVSEYSYFDNILQVYRDALLDDVGQILIPTFHKTIKEVFQDQTRAQKLKELGATELDFALINNDEQAVIKLSSLNNETSIYGLAKQYRMSELHQAIHNNSNLMFQPIVNVNGEMFTPSMLVHGSIFITKSKELSNNMLVSISDIGNKAWDYNIASKWSEAFEPFFDTQIKYGNGSTYILRDQIPSLLNSEKLQVLSSENYKFALVRINMHDSMEKGGAFVKILKTLPVKLAETTVFFIQACYSGQYHKEWLAGNKNIHLVTSSGPEESSNGYDMDKVNELFKYWNDRPSLLGFLKFLSENYTRSIPHYSGELEGKVFKGTVIKEVLNSIGYSSDTIPDSTITVISENKSSIIASTKHRSESEELEIWSIYHVEHIKLDGEIIDSVGVGLGGELSYF